MISEERSQLDDVINEVGVSHSRWLVDHAHVVEDVVLSCDELQQDDSDWPNVGVVGLQFVVQNRLDWHVSFSSDFVVADRFQTFGQSFVDLHVLLLHFELWVVVVSHSDDFLFQFANVGRIQFSQAEVNDHSPFRIGIVEEIARLDVPMVDSQFLQVA